MTAQPNDLMTPKANDGEARIGGFTLACRVMCSLLIACPLLYVHFVVEGDAYHFLAMVLLAPVAGLVLMANSLFCLFRYRKVESSWVSVVYVLIGVIGFLVAWHYLPQFRM